MQNNTPLIVVYYSAQHLPEELPGEGRRKTFVFKSDVWTKWGFVLLFKSGSGQFTYPSFREQSSCKASWLVLKEVAGFCKYPSEHGRTGSLKLEVQGWNVPPIPITFPEEHKDSRHGSSTCKTTRSPSISRQWSFPSVVKVFFDSLHRKSHIHVMNFLLRILGLHIPEIPENSRNKVYSWLTMRTTADGHLQSERCWFLDPSVLYSRVSGPSEDPSRKQDVHTAQLTIEFWFQKIIGLVYTWYYWFDKKWK